MEDGIKLSKSDVAVFCSIYPVDQIFVQNATLYPDRREVVVTCAIPPGVPYTREPVPYVTKEQQIRCLSQGTYTLVGCLLQAGMSLLPQRELPVIGQREFEERRDGFGLFYRREDLTYKRNIPRDREFQFTLKLGNVEQKGPFTLADFIINGPTQGTVTFVAK